MLKQVIETQFVHAAKALQANLSGITEEAALLEPPGGGNCINWMLGHIVASRETILQLLGEESVWEPELAQQYARGSAPLRDRPAPEEFTAIKDAFENSQQRLLRGLAAVSPAVLEETVGSSTRAEQLAVLSFHESYHIGQIGLVRRALGYEGAIR